MKFILLFLFFFVAVTVAVIRTVPEYDTDEVEWQHFKEHFHKNYSAEEEAKRLAIFKVKLQGIKEHNEKYRTGEVSSSQGITKFADLTHEEFVNRFTMKKWGDKPKKDAAANN